MTRLIPIALLLAAAGCAGKEVVWSKPEGTYDEYARDAARCRNQARAVVASSRNPYIYAADIANDCMVANGWTRVER